MCVKLLGTIYWSGIRVELIDDFSKIIGIRKVVLLGPSRHLQDYFRFPQYSDEPQILPMSLNLLGTIHRSGNNEKYIKKAPTTTVFFGQSFI